MSIGAGGIIGALELGINIFVNGIGGAVARGSNRQAVRSEIERDRRAAVRVSLIKADTAKKKAAYEAGKQAERARLLGRFL